MRRENRIVARQATLKEIFHVRWQVLRPGRPMTTAQFLGDDDPYTIHGGAFDGHSNVACATFTLKPWNETRAWQLRGMGVLESHQGKGVGQLLLTELERLAKASIDLGLLWCNARQEAVKFYEKQGWQVASEQFHIDDVGPHFKMTKTM